MNKIILDEWLTNLIGKPTYSLQKFNVNIKLKDLPEKQVFIWSKISVDDIERLICLQRLGFYIVDTNIQLSLSKKPSLMNNPNIRFAKLGDEAEVKVIAKSAFKYNRFNMDPYISNQIASKIKENWVANFFLGKRGKWMIVVEENSRIKGFLQLIDKNKSTIIIDLIAVDKKSRGKGWAKKMILYAYENCLKKNGTIEAGTQLANKLSIKFYTKLGFYMNSASYVLHLHK